MGMISRADAYQRRHRWAGLPVAVVYKFFDDQGSYLAAQITYYGVVSLFPLLLLVTTFLGYGLHGSVHFQREVLDSALAQFPVVGDQIARNIHSFHGSVPGLVVGIVGCLYGGLGIVQATQNALNKVWGVPRNARHNPLRARLRSLMLLAAGGGSVIVTTVLSALSAAADAYGAAAVSVSVRAAAATLAIALNVTLFMVAFKILIATPVERPADPRGRDRRRRDLAGPAARGRGAARGASSRAPPPPTASSRSSSACWPGFTSDR